MTTPVLPDFTRWQWAGQTERAWFKPQFDRASRAFMEMERWSVVDGLRPAAYQFVSFEDAPSLSAWATQNGLAMIVVSAVHASGAYSASSSGAASGPINAFRCVFVSTEKQSSVLPFEGDEHIGALLGFPACCRDAFKRTWGTGGVDSTYEQYINTQWNTENVPTFAENSTMLRWMGIRLVPHMPCSYNCQASRDLALGMLEMGLHRGYAEEVTFIKRVLEWPVQWSRLFGIAEIITPALKIVTRSDWTPEKQEFSITTGRSYIPPKETWWTDNGFSDPDAMRTAHAILMTSVIDEIPSRATVLDLGCGDGLLMRKLKEHRKDVRIGGIDMNADAIARIPMLTGKFVAGQIQDIGKWMPIAPDVVFINPVRLLEMNDEDRQNTRKALTFCPKKIVVYSYSDAKMPLEDTIKQVGLEPVRMLAKTPHVSVGVC